MWNITAAEYLIGAKTTGEQKPAIREKTLYSTELTTEAASSSLEEKAASCFKERTKKCFIANGALGIIELNKDYTLKKVMKPLIASNMVTDEIERANLFKMNGKWYLFTDSRGSKMTIDGIGAKDIYMLGYVSDSLTGRFKPLNKSGTCFAHGP